MRWRKRLSADIDEAIGWLKPPAPASPPVPGITPGAGAPSPGSAVTPRAASPGTGLYGIYGRCVMTVRFYDTGITVTDDHIRRRTLVDVPPAGEWGIPVWSDEPCPDCEAPAGGPCHWYCVRYAEDPGTPAETGDDPDAI